MCKVLEDMRQEAVENDRIERVKNLLKLGKLTLEEISSAMGLPLDKVKEISTLKSI